jgi:eukaryotic-like serine/threonine-protein kinase
LNNRKRLPIKYWIMGIAGGLLVILVVLLSLGPGYKIYKNPFYGFSIKYPAKWTMKEDYLGTVVAFYSPQETALDFFSEKVNIVGQDIQPCMTLEKYTKTAVDQLKAVFGANAQIEETEPMTVARLPGARLVFVGQGDQTNVRIMNIWTINGAKAYQINFTATANDFQKYLPFAMKMVNSFKFL